jgi:hypothetical protein
VIAPAVWKRGRTQVEVRQNGQVIEDGDLIYSIDRVGRVVDDSNEPVAILLPDGHVAGPNDRYLGRVGLSNASPPDADVAWLSVMPDGSVVRFDADGQRASDGRWSGCNGPQMRVCTLVTHLLAVRDYGGRSRGGVGIGVGVGIGIYR